jgi:acyl-CoA synthetase (AMP-forming)/AMP-acid ligase II
MLQSLAYAARLLRGLIALARLRPATIAQVFELQARGKHGDRTFLLYEERRYSYREANACINRVAHAYAGLGLRAGDVVALMLDNRPEFLWHFLAAGKLGVTASLLNTHHSGAPLLHSLRICAPKLVIVGSEHALPFGEVRGELGDLRAYEDLDPEHPSAGQLPAFSSLLVSASEADPPQTRERRRHELAAYIYTSGTTGLPKAAKMSAGRIRRVAQGFATMAWDFHPNDVLYDCLPLYHTSGLLGGASAVICNGATLALARRFSASRFWDDVRRHDATAIVYIGELCRYLVVQPPRADDRKHRVRIAVGNGLRADIWREFQERFGIARIAEFYGATEGNVATLNRDNTVGSVGRLVWGGALARWDEARGDFERGADGFLMRCQAGETGVLLGRIAATTQFDGYQDASETERKIIRNAFKRGDAWFNTGDLLRIDDKRRLYFVDRLGDTFRWKGENVSTFEVQEQLARWPLAVEANVYGVSVPGAEGRAGMAALVVRGTFDASSFKAHVDASLPSYARPLFVRVLPALETTSTFKLKKAELRASGFDPHLVADPLYVLHAGAETYEALTPELFAALAAGKLRL